MLRVTVVKGDWTVSGLDQGFLVQKCKIQLARDAYHQVEIRSNNVRQPWIFENRLT